MERKVIPEILDGLTVDDPRAIRSRRDLRIINALMGNERWVVRQLEKHSGLDTVSELGAGRGELITRLTTAGWQCHGYDLQPEPANLPVSAIWSTGDFFEFLEQDQSAAVVGSLILHHFEEPELAKLGELLSSKKLLIFSEPLRSSLAIAEGYLLFPLVNAVTKFDMMTSIRAGFLPGELPAKLGLEDDWEWHEKATVRGGLRSVALRKEKFI